MAIYGSNIVVVLYELLEGADEIEMELLPLVSSRKTHELTYQNDRINKIAFFKNNLFSYTAYKGNPSLLINFDAFHHASLFSLSFHCPSQFFSVST